MGQVWHHGERYRAPTLLFGRGSVNFEFGALASEAEPGYPHFESPQFKQVVHPSIITTAAVLHLAHSCAPSGKCDLEKASVCLARASNSARFSCTSLRWCTSSSGFLSIPMDCRCRSITYPSSAMVEGM